MLSLIPENLNRYIEKQYQEKDGVLSEMESYGEKLHFPFVGPQVGHLLFILTQLLKPKRIFEMGSGYGYSAYWFAKALPPGGKVYQTDDSQKNSSKSLEFFQKGGLLSKTEFLVGDALTLFDQMEGDFDIIFIDMDKKSYPEGFLKAKRRLRKGGLLIADNTLWSGKVLDKNPDQDTQGILKFTQLLFNDPGFFSTLVPIRDGVALGYKL